MEPQGAAANRFPVRVIGGPTVFFEYGGLRILTDPTFDPPGDQRSGSGRTLTKTGTPAATPADLGRIDVVLLSHDEHADNLDTSGRALLARVPLVLTTPDGARRLGGTADGLADWEPRTLERHGGGTVTVTGVPAVHGPDSHEGVAGLTGPVLGFVLTGDGLPTVYVSGDNASLAAVRAIADRFAPVDTAVLFAGAPRFPALFDGAPIVLTSGQAAEAAALLGARRAVPAHYDSWAHFTEGRDELLTAFTAAGLADRLDFGVRG